MKPQVDNTSTAFISYNAYLIRLWQDTPGTAWRASAQSAQSGRVVRFGSLQALFAYLEDETRRTEDLNHCIKKE